MFPSNVFMVWTTLHATPDSVVWHVQGNDSKFMIVHCCAFSPSTWRTWDSGCLPFTWANHSVYGVGKWFAKLGTGKFCPGIAFIISVPFTEKRPRRLETGIKDGFEGTEHEFPFGIFHREKHDYHFRCSVALEIFRWEDLKSRVPFTFQPDFPENFCKW